MQSVARCVTVVGIVLACASGASADSFGTGANAFDIDFVTISANPGVTRSTNTSGDSVETFTTDVGVGDYTDPGNDYRMGTFEITNDQWDKFEASLGVPVTGDPSSAYNESPYYTGTNVPANCVSWYEAAQFVNWLNTSTNHQPAYKFTGTQGDGVGDPDPYTLATWSDAEADNGTNLYRHKDAKYYLPTEDEWVKAAYWNGATLQTYATTDDLVPVADVESNYNQQSPWDGLWDVDSGSEELNGTYNMMGNVWEWMENPYSDSNYGAGSIRPLRGGSYYNDDSYLASSFRYQYSPTGEGDNFGFRVASVPEPSSLGLLLLGGLAVMRRKRR